MQRNIPDEKPTINLDLSRDEHNRISDVSDQKRGTSMSNGVKLHPTEVVDSEILQNCKRILNEWSASLPFSPSRELGNDAKLVSASQYYIYKFGILTDIAQRSFSLEKKPTAGNASRSPKDIKSYALWDINSDNLTSNLRVLLPDTCYEENCDVCHGRSQVPCPSCGGNKKETCSHCHGSGQIDYEVTVTCPVCHGKGKVNYGKEACPRCTMGLLKLANYGEGKTVYGGSGKVTETRQKNCPICHGRGEVNCSECFGRGTVDCRTCNATGRLEYTWAMLQQQRNLSESKVWLDAQAPAFTTSFCEPQKLSPESVFSISAEKEQVAGEKLPQLQCHFFSELRSFFQKKQDAISNTSDIFIHRQQIILLKLPAAIRYEYQYDGGTYVAWINPANDKVVEFDDGLIVNYAESFIQKGKMAANFFNPAGSFYNFAKGYTCDPANKDALRLAEAQLEKTSKWLRIPMWVTYFAFWALICYKDIAFVKSKIGIIYAICGFLLILLFGKLFAKDLALKLVGGCLGLFVAGVGLGYIASPKNITDFAAIPESAIAPYVVAVVIIMAITFFRKWRRKKISNWAEFVKNAKKTNSVRKMTESLKPGIVSSSILFFLIASGATYSYLNSTHGVTPEIKYNAAMAYLSDDKDTSKGLRFLQNVVNADYLPALYQYGVILLDGQHGVPKDVVKGVGYIQKSANAGLPEAQVKLGNCLENGVGIAQNLTDAHMWYDKAAGIDADAKKAAERIANIAQYWTPAHNGDKEAQYNLGLCYAKGDGITKNQETARNWFLKSADQGFPMAQVHAGVWLVNGIGGAKDAAKGIAYCEKAAEQDLGDAYGVLGEYYFDGKVVPKDYGKALKYFTLSAEKGIPVSMFYLGICYNNGFGTEKDSEKAFKYYQQAANKNIIAAHHALGECYENGIGVIIDYTKALEHYSVAATDKDNWVDTRLGKTRDDSIAGQKRLASIGKSWALANEKNDAQAQCDVGTCYFNGNGVKKDLSSALKWFRKAAAQGNLEGIVRVADCQFYGYGIDTNQAEAIQTYVKAAEQGQPHALFRLGECYEYGTGVEQNLTTAASWYKKAVEQKYNPAMEALKKITRVSNCWDKAVRDNDPAAQLELGKCYWFGDGIPKNQITAFTWFKKSGQQGNGEALHALGICYENGQGTDKNLANAIKFYNESAKKEYIPAVFTLAQKYQQGIGVSQNLTTAYELYTRAASAKYKNADEMADQLREIAKYWSPAIIKGEAQAQYMLSKCYNSGNGVQRDTQKAREFLEKSAQQNYAAAQFDLAQLLRSEAKSEADDKLIADWLIKAAANGHVEAQVQLGELYYTGKGVREDYDKAIELWEKAVAQKNAQAMFLLGNYRFTGRGIFNSGKDVDKALELWKSASDLGHVDSSFKLGEYYYGGTGMFGSGKDRKLAYAFYEKAAQGGHVEAMYKFGEGLYEGDDIKRNKTLGIEWLRKAAANGNEAAKRFLDKKKIPLIAPTTTARKTPAAIPQSTPSSSPTAKIDGGMIGVKTAADDAKQRDIAPQLQALIDKWSPEKLVIGKILPVNGEQDRLLEISGAKGNDKKVTIYVEMSFNTNEFYSKLVPEFRELLDIVSTKKQTVSRNFKRTDRGGFWWGNYEQRNKSPYRLQAHVFSPKDMVPKNSSIAVFLRNKGDDFTVYELSQSANIISVLDANKSKIFVVTATFFDKNDKEVVSFSRDITFSTDRIQAYFPLYSNLIVFPMNITGDRLMISPEFSGERNVVEGADAFNFHEKLVRKVEGIMTVDQLQRVSSVKITFTTR